MQLGLPPGVGAGEVEDEAFYSGGGFAFISDFPGTKTRAESPGGPFPCEGQEAGLPTPGPAGGAGGRPGYPRLAPSRCPDFCSYPHSASGLQSLPGPSWLEAPPCAPGAEGMEGPLSTLCAGPGAWLSPLSPPPAHWQDKPPLLHSFLGRGDQAALRSQGPPFPAAPRPHWGTGSPWSMNRQGHHPVPPFPLRASR